MNKNLTAILEEKFGSAIKSGSLKVSVSLFKRLKEGGFLTAVYEPNLLVYPASMAKVFVAAGVLYAVYIDKIISLTELVTISEINCVDKDFNDVSNDGFPIIQPNEKHSVDYLINRMLVRSDNTATNQLIDLVGREYINEKIIAQYGLENSFITRKYITRTKEDIAYQQASPLQGSVLAYEKFLKLLLKGEIGSQEVSQELLNRMKRVVKRPGFGSIFAEAKDSVSCAHKGGWFKTKTLQGIIHEYICESGIVFEKTGTWGYVILTHQKYPEKQPIVLWNDISKTVYDFAKSIFG